MYEVGTILFLFIMEGIEVQNILHFAQNNIAKYGSWALNLENLSHGLEILIYKINRSLFKNYIPRLMYLILTVDLMISSKHAH